MTAILKNWHFARFFRAGIAIWAFEEAFRTGETFMMIPGALFAFQAIFDVGCCGSSGCGVRQDYTQAAETEVVVEEVKQVKQV